MYDQPPQPISQRFYDLAPITIGSYRSVRYDGGAMGVALSLLSPTSHRLLQRMYSGLQQVYDALKHQPEPPVALAVLRRLYDERWDTLLPQVRELGRELPLSAETAPLRKVLHDIKGGAFQALAVYLQLIALDEPIPVQLHRIFFLARDQLKIMRNALPGIDPEGLARDEQQRLHAVELLVEKWQRAQHALSDQAAATVEVSCFYQGAIAERCLEFAALDRVLYNLMNNAVRYSADGRVELAILPVAPAEPQHLRFVVANAVSPAQRRQLEPRPATELFQGGFSTSGSGLGLRICADFVCNAYGLSSIAQGVSEGHLGAVLRGDRFLVWVHWPLAAD